MAAARSLDSLLGEWERDRSLREPKRLRQRIELLDRLEGFDPAIASNSDLRDRFESLRTALESINQHCYRTIRDAIRQGSGRRALQAWLPAPGNAMPPRDDGERYDYLDTLIAGVLSLAEPSSGIAELASDMVFYQPTPARHIFDFLQRSRLAKSEVLMDLGSGLGQVPLLAAIGTGARCIGIEREAAYVDSARRCAEALDLDGVSFIHQDARTADLSVATIFYLYTPFTGTMLGEMLSKLEQEARRRPIRIGTLGPCTPIVAREPWLRSQNQPGKHRPMLFHSI